MQVKAIQAELEARFEYCDIRESGYGKEWNMLSLSAGYNDDSEHIVVYIHTENHVSEYEVTHWRNGYKQAISNDDYFTKYRQVLAYFHKAWSPMYKKGDFQAMSQ